MSVQGLTYLVQLIYDIRIATSTISSHIDRIDLSYISEENRLMRNECPLISSAMSTSAVPRIPAIRAGLLADLSPTYDYFSIEHLTRY